MDAQQYEQAAVYSKCTLQGNDPKIDLGRFKVSRTQELIDEIKHCLSEATQYEIKRQVKEFV
ncbi:hypothetical protein [Sphingobacterium prati]|uniref:hypothetical protein n=1 Tax=Sphingobacterium prati TaxID=2737006 RepID=UPI00155461E7|nr:hypothetical protein [Sphingobacterium prati]NPE46415.1 hypothetical protein [Sphingobacterium prati]